MDNESLSRRERRHHRKFVDGKVVYNIDNNIEMKNKLKSDYKENSSNLEVGSLLDLNEKPTISIDKQKIIKNTLNQLSEMISPDIDEISDVISSQLRNQNISIEKKVIVDVVKNSKHYRSSKNKSNPKPIKDLESVVKDVYNQIEKEHIRKEIKDKKESLDSKKSKDFSSKQKDSKLNSKKSQGSSSNAKNSKVKNQVSKKPKDNFKDLLDDDSSLDSEDDLGLKF